MRTRIIRGSCVNFPCGVAAPALAVLLAASPALAQLANDPATKTSPADVRVTSYPVDFFAELGAVSALDMVRLVPGFTFENSEDSRGYAGAAGNVLINGRRPSTKATRLQILLRRIPAQVVERIDVIRGAAPGIDMQGLPVVANIVRRAGASDTGGLEALGKFYSAGDVGFTGRAERSRQSASYTIDGYLEVSRDVDDDKAGEGPQSAVDAAGNILEEGKYKADYWTTRVRALSHFEKETANGLFRANVALTHTDNDEEELTDTADSSGGASLDVVDTEDRVDQLEIGADYDGGLGDGSRYQLLALQTLTWEQEDSSRTGASAPQLASAEAEAGESILRGLLRHPFSPRMTLEGGAEVAFNFLDSSSALSENGQAIDVPAADVLVEELRGEIYSTLTTRPSEQTLVEISLRGEKSRITVTGDAEAENQFAFLKPRVSASYSTGKGQQLRMRIEREVGQLDFEDFAAGSELGDGTVNAGNVNLEPERSWVYEAAFEQPFMGDGAFTLTYRHFDIQEVVDVVPVDGFSAPGNIGDGRREEVSLSLSLPLDEIGPGLGRLRFAGTWRDSQVTDPVTGTTRAISEELPFEGEIDYTRDFPSLNGTLGVRTELTSKETEYRLDQVITQRNEDYWRLYWEWRARPNVLVRLQLENLASRDRYRHRVRYAGSRSDGVIATVEDRSAVLDPLLAVRLRWSF